MNNKFSLLFVFAVIGMMGATPAFAIISGEVTNTSSLTLNGAQITSEQVGQYEWTTQPSSGDYSVGPNEPTNNWIAAMQYFFQRSTQSGISDSATNVDFSLNSQTVNVLNHEIAISGMSLTAARSHIGVVEAIFQTEHSINFTEENTHTWTASGSDDCPTLIDEMQSAVGWSSTSSDVLIGFVNKQLTVGGNNVHACTVEFGNGATPTILIGDTTSDFDRTIMHELSHDYGIAHITSSCSGQHPNIMAFGNGGGPCTNPIYIKNWANGHDSLMQSNRGWY